MRPPNVPSLVIVLGCCLRFVGAGTDSQPPPPTPLNGPPVSIRIVPTFVLEPAFAVTWDNCQGSQCNVEAFTLLQVEGPGSTASPVEIASVTNVIAAASVNPLSTYKIALEWQTALSTGTLITSTTGDPFTPPPITGTSSSGTSTAINAGLQSSTIGASSTEALQANSADNPVATSSSPASTLLMPPILTSGLTTTSVTAAASSGSSGLSTGAKVGIAIGAIGVALIVLIGALLLWRRRRQQHRALPDRMPYSHDIGSTNRDLTAEKEMNVINSPVDTLHNGYSAVPSAPIARNQSQTGSWASPDEHSTTGGTVVAAAVPYTDAHRRSYGSGYANSSSPGPEMQSTTSPIAASGSAIQRKPVGATSGGTTHHLREPGMSDEEVARLEEEERRLDEAIAEAERKRQIQG